MDLHAAYALYLRNVEHEGAFDALADARVPVNMRGCSKMEIADSMPRAVIVEHKLYWSSFTREDEAHYVVALSNSAALNEAIKPFQSMGLMGERDIEKKVLDVPFPASESGNSKHAGGPTEQKGARTITGNSQERGICSTVLIRKLSRRMMKNCD